MVQLIISEKPNAASKLASALGDFKKVGSRTYYFEGEIGGTETFIVPAVGHLFGLAESKKRQGYPALEVEWVPTYEKKAKFSKPYFNQFKKLAKKADKFIIATDFDREGEVIGYNILKYIFKKQDAMRMKFSTLTASDLKEAYKNMLPHIASGQANAGLARHYLDFFYGISLSKAATGAVSKAINGYRQLSMGRVQGPSLAILAKREKDIAAFIPKPYWQIFADVVLKGKPFEAIHEKNRFWDSAEAQSIFSKVNNKPAIVKSVEKRVQKVLPPTPFDLTTLQLEAYRCFRMSPKMTLAVAQRLYTNALISYPRTSSQKLPQSIDYKKILKKLTSQTRFSEEANIVLKGPLNPTQGKKTDAAHPAIYPTGERPKKVGKDELMLYDLIVRRFMACFGKPGERELTKVKFDIVGEMFVLNGIRTIKIEWQRLYGPYSNAKELELPLLREGEMVGQSTRIEEKETQPPKRYTPASLIKELEKNNLGTKATRANIIDILYQRNYIEGRKMEVTKLGSAVVKVFSQYSPQILSVEMTAAMERSMDAIEAGKVATDAVLSEAKRVLVKICEEFDASKEKIGEGLAKALRVTEKEQNTLCTCPKCGKNDMRVIRSKKTRKRFLACTGYPDCKNTWGLPQLGGFKTLDEKCKTCGISMVAIYKKGKRPWHLCVNPDCESKKEDLAKKEKR